MLFWNINRTIFFFLFLSYKFSNPKKKVFAGEYLLFYLSFRLVSWLLRIDELISGSFRHPDRWIIKISFSLKSFAFTASIVPIASYLMFRSKFSNGAHNELCSWVNLLSLYWLEALDFLFCSIIYKKSRLIVFVMEESVLMLYYTAFYEMAYRPYILEFYIIDILFFLSLILPFIYIFLLYFALQLKIGLIFFFAETKNFSCYKDMTDISHLDCFFRSR